MDIGHDQILSLSDTEHYISLCEYGLVHVEWGRHSLVYCPGDLIGLSYLLASINTSCELECMHGEQCKLKNEDNLVSLPYGSVEISLTADECQGLHFATQEASRRLHSLRSQGYFSNQKWLPQAQLDREARFSSRCRISSVPEWRVERLYES